jgi:Xaa-Pro aminopeptidase
VNAELQTKVARLRAFCEGRGYQGVLLRRRAGFAWLSCGGTSTVERSVEWGVADLLVTRDRLYAVASEIERYRIMEEELGSLGFELATFPWGGRGGQDALEALRGGRRMAADCPVPGFEDRGGELAELRFALTPDEAARARRAARTAATSFEAVCRDLRPGMTEHDAAALLAAGPLRSGGDAPVVLVAFDDRMLAYRHPAPTAAKLLRKALLVRCSEQHGLVTSISRIVTFGEPEPEFRSRYLACAKVNAALIAATLPGAVAADVFGAGVAAYGAVGYPEEWKRHHQGGALGYRCRDYVADATCREVVQEDQLFAWNPSIAGTKLEDSILVTRGGQEILTEMAGWPVLEVSAPGQTVRCADILVR